MPRDDAAEEEPSAELLHLAEQARPVFARAGDEIGLTDAWVASAWAELIRCRWAAMLEAVEQALEHARCAGYVRWERELPVWKGTALFYGPTPVDEVLRWYDQEQPQHSMALNQRAVLEAMRGRFADARALLAAADAAAAEFGETVWRAGGGMAAWEVETLAGDTPAAEASARRRVSYSSSSARPASGRWRPGNWRPRCTRSGGSTRRSVGRRRRRSSLLATTCSRTCVWRQVRAKLLARGGRHADAERLAREAVGLGEETDMLNWHANTLTDLAEVYVLARRPEEGRAPLEQALALYERKGNVVSAGNGRSALAQLRETRPLVTERKRH